MNHKQIPKYISWPLSKLYECGVNLRNRLFDWKILKQYEFDVPIVVVGNIAVGGTGKTPHIEHLIIELQNYYNIGVVSRGYRRKTSGFVLATTSSTPQEIGDEPYQIFNKFNGNIPVAVCEKRKVGISKLMQLNDEINLILLDDAFQHRYVKPSVSILLTEFHRPLFDDHMMPYGNLREPIEALNRTDMVVVTKCPEQIKPMESRIFNNKLKTFPYQHLSFSKYKYGQPIPLFANQATIIPFLDWLSDDDIIFAICGIGNPQPFIKELKTYNAKIKITTYPDHHDYSQNDINFITKRFLSFEANNKYIITTEKDAVKFINNQNFPKELMPYIFYLPIDVEFLNIGEGPDFISSLKALIEKDINNKQSKIGKI